MQVYIKLTGQVAEWYNQLPPRGKSEAINNMLLSGINAENTQMSQIKRDIAEIKHALLNGVAIQQAKDEKETQDFNLFGLESMADEYEDD